VAEIESHAKDGGEVAGLYGFCDLSAFASRLDCLSPQLKIKQVVVPQWACFTGRAKQACGQAHAACILNKVV
jgi:hypothetical protein